MSTWTVSWEGKAAIGSESEINSTAAAWVTVYSSVSTQLSAMLPCTESVLLMSHNC